MIQRASFKARDLRAAGAVERRRSSSVPYIVLAARSRNAYARGKNHGPFVAGCTVVLAISTH